MVRSRGELSPSSLFCGVRFVLFGFDSVSEEQYRLEITQRGVVDLGKYNPSCTHVIVCVRVYILYRPVKDLDGIPGSKSLHICSTGIQRQQREEIMSTVIIMGARFRSRSLQTRSVILSAINLRERSLSLQKG